MDGHHHHQGLHQPRRVAAGSSDNHPPMKPSGGGMLNLRNGSAAGGSGRVPLAELNGPLKKPAAASSWPQPPAIENHQPMAFAIFQDSNDENAAPENAAAVVKGQHHHRQHHRSQHPHHDPKASKVDQRNLRLASWNNRGLELQQPDHKLEHHVALGQKSSSTGAHPMAKAGDPVVDSTKENAAAKHLPQMGLPQQQQQNPIQTVWPDPPPAGPSTGGRRAFLPLSSLPFVITHYSNVEKFAEPQGQQPCSRDNSLSSSSSSSSVMCRGASDSGAESIEAAGSAVSLSPSITSSMEFRSSHNESISSVSTEQNDEDEERKRLVRELDDDEENVMQSTLHEEEEDELATDHQRKVTIRDSSSSCSIDSDCEESGSEDGEEDLPDGARALHASSSSSSSICPVDPFSYTEEYCSDILEHLKRRQLEDLPRWNYMSKQLDITFAMRSILVDWLVEVSEEYRLQTETVYLAVNYVDRFLSVMSVQRAKLQLVGSACMFIAAKYEEIYPPDVSEFVYITDDAYTKRQILRMEHLVLGVLDFRMNYPTTYFFTNFFAKMAGCPEKVVFLAQYLSELTLLNGEIFLGYLPSIAGAASVALARHTLGLAAWEPDMVDKTGYTVEDFESCLVNLHDTFIRAGDSPQQSIVEKYKLEKNFRVSEVKPTPIS